MLASDRWKTIMNASVESIFRILLKVKKKSLTTYYRFSFLNQKQKQGKSFFVFVFSCLSNQIAKSRCATIAAMCASRDIYSYIFEQENKKRESEKEKGREIETERETENEREFEREYAMYSHK